MQATLRLIFLAFAIVLFLLAGFSISTTKLNFGWLGLAFLTAALWFH
jgi:hypothetical protein